MIGPTCDCCCQLLLIVCHFWGIATVVGLWGVGIEAVYYQHALGYYLLPLVVILSFSETVFLQNYLVQECISGPGICERIWEVVLKFDDWKKGVVYVLLAVPCFVSPATVPLGIVSGAMLAVTSALYCVKTLKTRREAIKYQTTYGRFQQEDGAFEEDLEESITNPQACMTAMSVADQTDILEL